MQTTGIYALDAGTVTLTDATAGIDMPLGTDDITLSGLVTGTGGLNKTGAGRPWHLASAAGNDYSGDTNVQAGTLLADTDNALSPASNLVIGDGASVVLNFGNVGAGFGLGGFGAPLPAVAPALAEPVRTRAGRHLHGARAGHAGALAGRSPGQPGRMAAKMRQ